MHDMDIGCGTRATSGMGLVHKQTLKHGSGIGNGNGNH